jgi:lipopolysaccharide transport system ATP-binding protein
MAIVIKAENISKQYRLGYVGSETIKDDARRWWARLRGKEDPLLMEGDTNDRSVLGESDYVWALKDINFEIEQGDTVGIIGRNGAGKSTLLKLLSKVTAPTTGNIKVKGRIASLLEVGTGFHGELTGRENIYLNGAIMGMRKHEITRKLDEIVDFAGVERYLDTPVKRYSSGMYVRLGFAVAAHLENEILIVDEVLAVGDAEFQKKCLGKMGDVAKGEGRTVLFVSHNIGAINQLCQNGMVLVDGKLIYQGNVTKATEFYVSSNTISGLSEFYLKKQIEGKDIELISAELLNQNLKITQQFDICDDIFIKLKIRCIKKVPGIYAYIALKNAQEELIIETDSFDFNSNQLDRIEIGDNIYILKINKNILAIGDYNFYVSFASHMADKFLVDVPADILKISIIDNFTSRGINRKSKTSFLINWEKQNV